MNKSQKINEACDLFFRLNDYLSLSVTEWNYCLDAIKRDPTGALRCYKAILASYGG